MPEEKNDPARTVSLNDLEPLAERLNFISDDLNTALKEIESRLAALSVGLEVYVDLRPEHAWYLDKETADEIDQPHGSSWTQEQLGLTRRPSGEWKLVVHKRKFIERGKARAEMPSNVTPLLQASREDRLAAVAKIPELLAAIYTKASAAVERVDRARELAKQLSETGSF